MSEPTQEEYRQTILDRIHVQGRAIEAAQGMLEGSARDYAHLMRRVSLRIHVERARANIERLRGKL